MIFIIRSDGNSSSKFIDKTLRVLGPSKVSYFNNCGSYELEFIKTSGVNPGKLTIIELHSECEIKTAMEYAQVFENKFNIPVFFGKVEDLWQ